MGVDARPADIAKKGLAKAKAEDYDAIIVDTAGRLQVHSDLPIILLSNALLLALGRATTVVGCALIVVSCA